MIWNPFVKWLTNASIVIDPGEVGVPEVAIDETAVSAIMNTVYLWAGTVAVLVIIIAGFYFITSRGDSSKIQIAKNAIFGAVIGLVIILLAFIITQFVIMGVTEGA